jgi:YVTN family beta-propeller protein
MRSKVSISFRAFGLFVMGTATAAAAGPFAYLASNDENTVSAVDLSNTAATPATITVGGTSPQPDFWGVAVTPDGGMVYVSDQDNEKVHAISTATNTVAHTYVVGSQPKGVAVNTAGTRVYVANFQSSGVSVIDTTTGNVTDIDFSNLPGSGFATPNGVALNPSGTRLYVSDSSTSHRVCRINTQSPPASVSAADCVVVGDADDDGANPQALAVNPSGTQIYVVNNSESSVSVIDTASFTVVRTFTTEHASPSGIAINAAGTRAYVGTVLGFIMVIDTAKVSNMAVDPIIATIDDLGIASVNGVAISPDGTRLCVADTGNSQLDPIDIVNDHNTLQTPVAVNSSPISIGQFTRPEVVFVGGFDAAGPK